MKSIRWWFWLGLLLVGRGGVWAEDWQEYLRQGIDRYRQAHTPADFAEAASAFRKAKALALPTRRDQQAQAAYWLGRAYYQQGDLEAAAKELEFALTLAPEDPAVHLWLGYCYAQQGRNRRAVEHLRRAYRSVEATPQERTSAREWLLSLYENPDLEALEPPEKLVTDRFIIKHYPREPVLGIVIRTLEEAARTIRDRLGLIIGEPTEVLIFRSAAEYQYYHQQRQLPRPEWSVACVANGRIFTYSTSTPTLFQTLQHEYTHVALRIATNDRRLPCWLDEGLASLVAQQFPAHRLDLERAYRRQALLPIDCLTVPSFSVYQGDRAYLAYLQSVSMVEVLLDRFGPTRLQDLLRLIGAGYTADEAFEAVLGMTQRGYLLAWQRELFGGY